MESHQLDFNRTKPHNLDKLAAPLGMAPSEWHLMELPPDDDDDPDFVFGFDHCHSAAAQRNDDLFESALKELELEDKDADDLKIKLDQALDNKDDMPEKGRMCRILIRMMMRRLA